METLRVYDGGYREKDITGCTDPWWIFEQAVKCHVDEETTVVCNYNDRDTGKDVQALATIRPGENWRICLERKEGGYIAYSSAVCETLTQFAERINRGEVTGYLWYVIVYAAPDSNQVIDALF